MARTRSRGLTRWQPFADLEEMRSRFDKLFAEVVDGEHAWALELDVVEHDDKLVVHANVPGIKAEEIKIDVEDDLLTISGEHTEEHEQKERRYVRRERRYGAFSRAIALPDNAQRDAIEATCHDGVLEVTIPLSEPPKHETRTITPKAA
jgi:HSP20 family protein